MRSNGVYIFKPVGSSLSAANKVVKLDDLSLLWHRRLGHPSLKVISSLPGLAGLCSQHCDLDCTICFMGKQPRNSFSLSKSKAVGIFDLIHCDIWGPNKILASCGARYFLTIVEIFLVLLGFIL